MQRMALVIFAERWQQRFSTMPLLLAVTGFGLIAFAFHFVIIHR